MKQLVLALALVASTSACGSHKTFRRDIEDVDEEPLIAEPADWDFAASFDWGRVNPGTYKSSQDGLVRLDNVTTPVVKIVLVVLRSARD